MHEVTRRQALLSALFGAGYVGLRALASGVPAAILLDPRRGLAANPPAPDPTAQFMVLSTSGQGDPLNGNVPGTYDDPGIVHPADARFAATNISLAGRSVRGPMAWGALPQAVLDRTVFFHHGTYTVVHGDQPKTQTLAGAVAQNDMLVSALAQQLAPRLGTVQTPPLVITGNDGEPITAEGRVQPVLTPSSLASVLTLPKGPLTDLQPLRDQTLDQLNAYYKQHGNAGQRNFLDRYATSQEQLRQTAGSLLNQLSNIRDNGSTAQMTAATAIVQMKLAPVVVVALPFGGDNHGDNLLQNEANQHVSSIAAIASLYSQLGSVGLTDKVTFMALNVFGRTMAVSHKQQSGRDHNADHHATVMIGSGLVGGVVGGVAPTNGDYGALPFDARTGAPSKGGSVAASDTFAAMGRTVGRAVGVAEADMVKIVANGSPVTAVLKNA